MTSPWRVAKGLCVKLKKRAKTRLRRMKIGHKFYCDV